MLGEIDKKNEKVFEKCVCFCDICVAEWRKNSRNVWDMKPAVALCDICKSFICADHSLYESDAEIHRCRDLIACRASVSDQDEGGGD